MSFIIDINQDQFVEKVIEKSKKTPVIVDFWAPWCGPCKQLTPLLEKLVSKKEGKIILAKINVDENQSLSSQLNIQSIPTIYAFVDGKPVDAFQGAQPESKIEKMIDKLIDATPGNEVPKLVDEAENFFKEKRFYEAKDKFENLIGLDPGNAKVVVGLIRCLSQLKMHDDAKEILESLDDEMLKNEEIIKLKILLNGINNKNNENLDILKLKVKENPNDTELKFELAQLYLKSNETESGFNELLDIFDKSPKWKDEAAKKKLLEYFDLLGFSDPNVVDARKKLSTMIFK